MSDGAYELGTGWEGAGGGGGVNNVSYVAPLQEQEVRRLETHSRF